MHGPDTVNIAASHHDLIAANGDRVAVIAAVNLDVGVIASIDTFHEYDGTVVVEIVSPIPERDRYDTYHRMLRYTGDAPDIVAEYVGSVIEDQERSDDPTAFTWEIIAGTDHVTNSDAVQDVLDTTVTPDRLDPPFDVPDDEPVATLSCTTMQRDVIEEANQRYGYADISIEYHRGETYIIGLTDDRAETLADACRTIAKQYAEDGMHEWVGPADAAERLIWEAAEDAEPGAAATNA